MINEALFESKPANYQDLEEILYTYTDGFTKEEGEYPLDTRKERDEASLILQKYYNNVEKNTLDYGRKNEDGTVDYKVKFSDPKNSEGITSDKDPENFNQFVDDSVDDSPVFEALVESDLVDDELTDDNDLDDEDRLFVNESTPKWPHIIDRSYDFPEEDDDEPMWLPADADDEDYEDFDESLNESKKTYRCDDCGYEVELSDDEYDGKCPNCGEHHGFYEVDESLNESHKGYDLIFDRDTGDRQVEYGINWIQFTTDNYDDAVRWARQLDAAMVGDFGPGHEPSDDPKYYDPENYPGDIQEIGGGKFNFRRRRDILDSIEKVDFVDADDDIPFDESLNEDTVKQGDKWVNKGKEGTHGKFKTKKEADSQRKAMFASGYHESLDEGTAFDSMPGYMTPEKIRALNREKEAKAKAEKDAARAAKAAERKERAKAERARQRRIDQREKVNSLSYDSLADMAGLEEDNNDLTKDELLAVLRSNMSDDEILKLHKKMFEDINEEVGIPGGPYENDDDYILNQNPDYDNGLPDSDDIPFKDDYELTESHKGLIETIEKHDDLNRDIFGEDDKLLPEVREKLLEIAKRFTDNLKEDGIEIEPKDIVLLGSNASYNYTPASDLDIHIIADMSQYIDEE